MCLRQRHLMSSHLIPAAIYDYCREGEHHPIRVGDGFVVSTDRQTQDYLLCTDCEDVLNKRGEKWISDKLATWERRFPLYDALTKRPPLFDEDGMAVYLGEQNPEIEVDKLVHFATGLFWKASVHPWKAGTSNPRIDLGPYSEEIRKWLRKESKFPEFIHLIVVVEKPQKAQITINDPFEGVRQGWRKFLVHVPGVLCMMAVGKMVDESIRALAITNTGNPINVSEELTGKFETLMAQSLRGAYKTQSFLRARAEAATKRKTPRT